MIPIITDTSTYADNFLDRCSYGTVHSVYNKTINIQAEGLLLALQTASSPLSPVSLITNLTAEEMQALPVQPGQTVCIEKNTIKILSSKEDAPLFKYSPARIYCSGLSPLDPDSLLMELKNRVELAVHQSKAGGFCPLFSSDTGSDKSSLILSAARERMSRCRWLLINEEYEEAAHMLTRLIGLGIGLTPSGDDFLCGVLAALTLCRLSSHPFAQYLFMSIEKHLTDTNDISRTFLHCALHNQYSQAVCCLSNPSLPPTEEILQTFQAVGHSSGMDTLCGILYTLNLITDLNNF